MLEVFVQSMFIGYSGAIMPGSLLTYTLDKSIRYGAKAGLLISIGHSLLELVLVLLIFLGIGKYLSAKPAQLIIGLLGGIVLICFGLKMLKDTYAGKVTINFDTKADNNYGNIIVGGALISASNPYFIVWWAAVGMGLIVNAYNTFGITGVILFYLGHITSDITWYVFVSALISKTRTFIIQKVYRIIVAILGIGLIGFGTSFLISSAKIAFQYL